MAAFLLAIVTRLLAATGEFWFDEIWSWTNAFQLDSAHQIITGLKHDNNHFLNTWVIYVLGPETAPFWYRLPAVIAGICSIGVVGALARPFGRQTFLLTVWAMSCCYVMVHYSSEARGYAYLLLFGPLYVWSADRLWKSQTLVNSVLCAFASIAGLLSHLTFVFLIPPVIGRTFIQLLKEPARKFRPVIALAHAVPLIVFDIIYQLNVREMVVGGGEPQDAVTAILQLFSLTAGVSGTGPAAVCAAVLFAGIALFGIGQLSQRDSSWMIFFALLLTVPMGALAVTSPIFVHARYFLVLLPFLLLAACQAVATAWRHPGVYRISAVTVIVLFVTLNGFQIGRLYLVDRASYRSTLSLMESQSSSPVLTVASDHDFRNQSYFDFLSHQKAISRPVKYFSEDEWPAEGPEWYFAHSVIRGEQPKPTLTLREGLKYGLMQCYSSSPLSGWNLAVYRKVADSGSRERH